jgi:5-methylcytosine-specific restriction protein B
MDKHNVILYGPPGTGKTWEALRFSMFWKGKNGPGTVHQVSFHPSYCYEDFVEGFRPARDGSGFHLRDGIFKTVCRKAADDRNNKYLLVIDEINRGDVARILGELITLIEGDKRGEEHSVLLQQSGKDFFVPDNLYILGTMNTADKSISLMDLAIRRRFLFYPCLPDPDLLDEGRNFLSEIEGIHLSDLLVGLNQRLVEVGVDRDRILGHSYFLIQKEVISPLEVLMNRMRYEIIPLVEEYCYADRSVMSRVLGGLVEDSGAVNSDVFDDHSAFIDAVKGLEAQ